MTTTNPYGMTPDEQSFARAGAQITPSDSADLASVCKGLWVAAEGTVRFTPVGNTDGTYITSGTLSAGTIIPYLVKRVWSTGTTATVASLDE